MDSLVTYVFSGCNETGVAWAGCVLCHAGRIADVQALARRFEDYRPAPGDDVFDVDRRLAAFTAGIFRGVAQAVGVSLRLPSGPGPCGGIIGDPGTTLSSASGTVEPLGNGLHLAAHPGGPGLVVAAGREIAAGVLAGLPPGASGPAAMDRLAAALGNEGIELALAVADGTGPGQQGFALALEAGSVSTRTLY